jgi:uncharacterized SAM-binding protein YcdF (DUF218 family)
MYCTLIVLVGILVLFFDFAYQTFSLRPGKESVDAIVVLAGGKGRVEEGVRLYQNRTGRWLLFVGVDPVVRKGDLYKGYPLRRSSENVVLENVSRNTLENAIYAKDMIAARKITSIALITSRYHMKRAELLFKAILPAGIRISPHPVDSSNLKEEWWSHRGSLRLLVQEFYKYYVYKLLFLFVSGDIHGDPLRLD